MKSWIGSWRQKASLAVVGIILASTIAPGIHAQTGPFEKTFPQSKATIEKILTSLQANLAGRLPALEGFAQPGEHVLDRYQRPYYQATVQVSSIPSGGSLVRVSTKITAWYNDPASAHSGYQLLPSNGRLETDLLDQLADQLASNASRPKSAPVATSKPSPESSTESAPGPATTAAEPKLSAPTPSPAETARPFSTRSQSLAEQERASAKIAAQPAPNPATSALQAEANSLEEALKSQAHPKNLVAVKKSGTPVVATPSLNARPEFLASAHDEFEMLNFNADWVHVRISGLSRGWIWRNSVEMPEGIPDTDARGRFAQLPRPLDLFHVIREETAPFPGDWAPLRGKNVKILSVQKVDENAKDSGAG